MGFPRIATNKPATKVIEKAATDRAKTARVRAEWTMMRPTYDILRRLTASPFLSCALGFRWSSGRMPILDRADPNQTPKGRPEPRR